MSTPTGPEAGQPPAAPDGARRLRVALVSPYDLTVPGGVQHHVAQLAAALREQGDDVVVIAPGTGEASDPGTRLVGRSTRVPFNDSVAPLGLWPATARATLATLRRESPDVVHVHEPILPWVSLVATLRAPAPVVGTFHAWSERDRAYRAIRPLARVVAHRLAARIAVSDAAARYHAGALGLPAGSFRVVPNGVDVARFAGAEPFDELVDPERPALLFVGRLEPRKGLEQLVRAFTILKATHPGLRLRVVGDGRERDRCEQLLPARLRADVAFLGRVEHADLPRFYVSSDLFVAPASGGESFGIVLAEAMAAGCAVVASDIPGYRSVVTDGVDGRLVAPGDPRRLAAAVGALLDNPSLARAMADQGRQTVTDLDWPVVAARVRRIYLQALAR